MIKQTFWRGLKVTIPLAVTIAIIVWTVTGIEALFGSLLQKIIGPRLYFPGLGFLVGIALIFCAGLLIQAWYVERLYNLGERLLRRIPVVKTLYSALADLMGFFDTQHQHDKGKPVLLKTPLGTSVAFITVEGRSHLPVELQGEDLVGVYVPLSYQIGGVFSFVPRSAVTPLSLPVDQVMGFIFSAGMAGMPRTVIVKDTP